MIVDQLSNAAYLYPLHPLFKSAFEFLSQTEFAKLDDGKHVLDGDDLFVIVATDQGKGREQAALETHRKYIDIQFVVDGADDIGWLAIEDCRSPSGEFDTSRDLGFYRDRPETWLHIPAKSFAIFYPNDAHAPLGCDGLVGKAVVKVRV